VQYGPFDEDEARTVFSQGSLLATDLAWKAGMPMWRPVGEVLAALPPPIPLGPPPVPASSVVPQSITQQLGPDRVPLTATPASQGLHVHQSAPTSVAASSQQTSNDLATPLSETWVRRFRLIEKAGGVGLRDSRNLTAGERASLTFNIWGMIFGPFYYLVKGMWRKSLSYTLVCFVIIEIVVLIGEHYNYRGVREMGFITAVMFALRANVDYYKKMRLGDKSWW